MPGVVFSYFGNRNLSVSCESHPYKSNNCFYFLNPAFKGTLWLYNGRNARESVAYVACLFSFGVRVRLGNITFAHTPVVGSGAYYSGSIYNSRLDFKL